jgi:hypothetical protein
MGYQSSESSFACNLAAIDRTQRERHQILLRHWTRAIQAMEELPNGYTFRFAPDDALWLMLAEFITLERRCCPFLAFSLTLEPDNGPMRLHLTGGDEVKQFLRSELALR